MGVPGRFAALIARKREDPCCPIMAPMSRRTRLAAAILALAATLFAPFAMALHACADNGDMAAPMAAMASANGGDAPAMDMTLCERHCHDGKVSFQPLGNPPSATALPVPPALRVEAREPVSLRAPAYDSPFAASAGPAPPLIGYTVLRI